MITPITTMLSIDAVRLRPKLSIKDARILSKPVLGSVGMNDFPPGIMFDYLSKGFFRAFSPLLRAVNVSMPPIIFIAHRLKFIITRFGALNIRKRE
jgi:hypothetical protein